MTRTVFVMCLTLFICHALPVKEQIADVKPTKILKFMKQYGYLVEDDGQSQALYTEEGLKDVIRTMQKYGGIEQTGIMDNDTLKLIQSPRCGVEDVPRISSRAKRYTTIEGWTKRTITYYIANWSPNLGENVVASNIQKALDIWGGYGRLKFDRVYHQQADIIVSFGSGYHGDNFPFDGAGLVLAHAFYPYTRGEYGMEGDIHFDNDENWADIPNNVGDHDGVDFFSVALHELGHSLGLAHSAVPSSVMFPYYKGAKATDQNVLDYDDVMAMYELYISKSLPDDNNIHYNHPTSEATTTKRHRDREQTTKSYPRYSTTEPTTTTTESTVSYDGDVETIDVHKHHDSRHHVPKNNSPSLPNICNGNVDAIATLRNELFVFKDEYVWRLREKGRILPNYPINIRHMFPELPKTIKKIDAAYQRPDGNIVMFTGNQLWISDGSRFIENSPLPLTYYDLPDYLDSIDAVQVWGGNGKTYFFKADRFWRYDDRTKTMEDGYPRLMDRWNGIPSNLDAATTWKDGMTYFFKGELFWKLDNYWVAPTDTSPLPIGPIWFGCEETPSKMVQLFGAK